MGTAQDLALSQRIMPQDLGGVVCQKRRKTALGELAFPCKWFCSGPTRLDRPA